MSATAPPLALGDERVLFRALASRDRRFDGTVWFGVTSTGIYCRPVCPSRTPLAANVRFFRSPSAAVAAGFRACRRCRPDAAPGSRAWDHRQDLAGRAMRLIADGIADDVGVAGLARRLAVSERHLHRTLVAEVGAGPLALASTRRAQTARLLIDQTTMSMTEIAFAAGFASLRRFNDVMRREFGLPPSALRRHRAAADRPSAGGPLRLRLAVREPLARTELLGFLAARSVDGVEVVSGDRISRVVATRSGPGVVTIDLRPGEAAVRMDLPDITDVAATVACVRRWIDLDADPGAIDAVLAADPALRDRVLRHPGLRVPGSMDGFELAVRAVVGQQVSVAAARTLLGRLAARWGTPIAGSDVGPDAGLRRTFPTPEALVAAPLEECGVTTARARTVRLLAGACLDGTLPLTPGADREASRRALLAVPGVGPWTADYVAMRALADPDAFPSTDLVLRRAVATAGLDPQRWRPWRAYGAMHLWTATAEEAA